MATKKSGRYRVLREFGGNAVGDLIDLDSDAAALLIRDGMITDSAAPEAEEG